MAKYETIIPGDFDEVLKRLHDGILNGSASASYEDGSDINTIDQNRPNAFRCAVRVYERFSFTGSNRLSLSMTLVNDGTQNFLSAITSGGSQAVFWKVNTFGEEAFLDELIAVAASLTE